ncbi:MAG: PQQ-dependent sugar dehydrogenase [Rhodothermales bacterium]|nr:PQQ-dependent sugar dehydrogenase [Rhodothermales bacterium]
MCRPSRVLALVVFLLALAPAAAAQVELQPAFPNLTFSSPVDFESDGSDRLYVVEQSGRIRTFLNEGGVTSAAVFLDIQNRVSSGGERGLLGLAFHPDYAENGYFYVNYTTGGPLRTRVSRFSRSAADPTQADPASEVVLLEFGQPFSNHNGGDVAFGPDGYLYVSTGDGGGGGDPLEAGQKTDTHLGKILRLDVDGGGSAPDPGCEAIPEATVTVAAYTVPADNPFVDGPGGACDAVYAYGLRNPWRMSFDRQTGQLWVGDVGQNQWEEVDLVTIGGNYGWNVEEAASCYDPPTNCNDEGLIDPVWFYSHSVGNSITGGFVYRGSAVPELAGRYVYADYGQGKVWALTVSGASEPENELLFDTAYAISSFGEDAAGELYFTDLSGGKLYRFDSLSTDAEPGGDPQALRLELDGPNPSRTGTRFRFATAEAGPVRLVVYDVLGREVAVLADEWAPAGDERAAAFDASALPAGLYVVRLESNGSTRTQRVLLTD